MSMYKIKISRRSCKLITNLHQNFHCPTLRNGGLLITHAHTLSRTVNVQNKINISRRSYKYLGHGKYKNVRRNVIIHIVSSEAKGFIYTLKTVTSKTVLPPS